MNTNRAQEKISRRGFLGMSAILASLVVGMMSLVALVRQVIPPLTKAKKKYIVGFPSDFPVNTFVLLPEHRVFIVRDHEGVRAMSAVCTHLGCILERSDQGFLCPCHGSRFDEKGSVVSGPASRTLIFFKVGLSPGGQLSVDVGHQVPSEQKYKIS